MHNANHVSVTKDNVELSDELTNAKHWDTC